MMKTQALAPESEHIEDHFPACTCITDNLHISHLSATNQADMPSKAIHRMVALQSSSDSTLPAFFEKNS